MKETLFQFSDEDIMERFIRIVRMFGDPKDLKIELWIEEFNRLKTEILRRMKKE